jgi:hypothetical protein
VMLTHGPDPARLDSADGEDPLGDGLMGPLASTPFDPDNAEDEGPDGSAGTGPPYICSSGERQRHIEVLYAGEEGAEGLTDLTLARIRRVMVGMNNKLYDEAVASGGRSNPARYRFACDKAGEITVEPYVIHGNSFGSTVERAKRAGHTNRFAKYIIFSEFDNLDEDGFRTCGEANHYPDDRLSKDNLANRGAYNESTEGDSVSEGTYGMVYGRWCWQVDMAMHENAHTMGAVAPSAPQGTGPDRGHCNDGLDVMCYDDPINETDAFTYRDDICPLGPRGTRYDCNYDTYFDTDPESGEWLESNWNLGDPLNLALSFRVPRAYDEQFVFFGRDSAGEGIYRGTDGGSRGVELVAGEPGTFMSALSPDARSIVYAQPSAADNCFELYYARVDGSERRKLFDCGSFASTKTANPAFAGSNAKLVFDCRTGTGITSDICGISVNDSVPETIVGWDGLQFDPDESGSRRLLAFASTTTPSGDHVGDVSTYSQIFITKRDGSNPVQFTSSPRFISAQNPKFSHDGNQLAFEAQVDGDETGSSIYVARIDGTGLRRVTSGFQARDPAWTPGGDLVYTKYLDDGTAVLIKEDLASGDTSKLASLADWSSHAAFRQAAYWQGDYKTPVPQPVP